MEIDNMDLSEHFSAENIKTLQDIVEGEMLGKHISKDTFRLIDFLDLNYLLFNYNIQENLSINNERIVEYYEIMKSSEDKNFLKKLLRNLGQSSVKLIDYKRLRTFINVCNEAVKINNLECLKYAHENKCPWNEWTCSYAAWNGYLECLKYAHENGCPWDTWTCVYAAKNGHLECLKYVHENKCPWNEMTCKYAAWGGYLECLKYVRENGCPWDEWTCVYAARNGHLECLKYAYEHGCQWDEKTCTYAASNRYLECLKYAHENGCPGSEKYVYLLQ
jgi:hypothetical protein